MRHPDHVRLLEPANLKQGGEWADLGAGSGAFTLALRELVGSEANIHVLDKDAASLRELEQDHRRRFGGTDHLHIRVTDFSGPLDLPPLDGILMANSLHFFKDQVSILKHVRGHLKPDGQLLVVEYNAEHGNPWVPHPVSFRRFQALAVEAGYETPRRLATHPSSFLREIYSAQATASQPTSHTLTHN